MKSEIIFSVDEQAEKIIRAEAWNRKKSTKKHRNERERADKPKGERYKRKKERYV